MKSRSGKNEESSENFNKSESINRTKKKMMMKKKKNMTRLGGGGLSLEAFANAKSKDNHYNPAVISMLLFLFSYIHRPFYILKPLIVLVAPLVFVDLCLVQSFGSLGDDLGKILRK